MDRSNEMSVSLSFQQIYFTLHSDSLGGGLGVTVVWILIRYLMNNIKNEILELSEKAGYLIK